MGQNTMLRYIGEYKRSWIRVAIFFVAVALIGYLYRISAESFVYMVLIFLAIETGTLFLEYPKWKEKMSSLNSVEDGNILVLDEFPETESALEGAYRNALRAIDRQGRQNLEREVQKKKDALDYYTLWAHQIKTPIAAMRLMVQSDEEISREEMQDELFRTEQYVEMVLQYARLGDMSQDLVLKKTDLFEMTKTAVKKYSGSFIRKRIRLDMDEFWTEVLTDEKWSSFVLEQILSNALKYTKRGGIIHIRNEGMKLIVEDEGIGIAPEALPRVFERGFTGYNGREEKRASGIGLYLCKEILSGLSHKIEITSAPGEGTKVSIDFTMRKVEIE